MGDLIPILGILTGIIVPIAVFLWLYHDAKHKRQTVLEIAKHIDDPEKLDELLHIFDERKDKPIDYRRNGVITIFTLAIPQSEPADERNFSASLRLFVIIAEDNPCVTLF